jgi:hypothetical protein
VMMALAKRAVQMGGNAKFFATAVRLAQQSYKVPFSDLRDRHVVSVDAAVSSAAIAARKSRASSWRFVCHHRKFCTAVKFWRVTFVR